MLEIRSILTTYQRRIRALEEVSLRVGENEVVAVLGANGAGKTTLLKTISGLLWPDQGEIFFEGRPIHRRPAHEIAAMGIAHVPEGRRIFPRMTVSENLEIGAFARRRRDGLESDRERVFHLFPVLKERARQLAGTLSGGEQQMLAIGRGMMARPRLLLLDEPSMGLAPVLVERIFAAVSEIHREGTPILLVEQNAWQALHLAERGYVLQTGRIAAEGDPKYLASDDRIREAYLGVSK